MCPLWPLHIILLYILALAPIWFAACSIIPKPLQNLKRSGKIFNVKFIPKVIDGFIMFETTEVNFSFIPESSITNYNLSIIINNKEIADVGQLEYSNNPDGMVEGSFVITGNYIGHTSAKLCLKKIDKEINCHMISDELEINVIRKKRLIDNIFTATVIILVSVIFVNFGCTLDTTRLKDAVIRPVGPIIGLICHFLLLPIISYVMGLYLFPDSPTMRLGLFFTGIAPAGGASNIWTFTLGGNLDMSITMTAVSTLASFGFIPLWVLTLGSTIFADGKMAVPFKRLIISGISPIISLFVGFIIQIYFKRLTAIMVRFLKLFSVSLILFIVVFAVTTNFYLFKLFSWEIILGGMMLPWIGYLCGWILSILTNQSNENKLAISIETGVQNTGISIFLLQTCLTQPDSDITTVVPVSVALMTPIPLVLFSFYKRICKKSQIPKETSSNTDVHLIRNENLSA